MKKIGIDARLYSQTGVGTYIKNLLYELERLPSENIQFYVYVTKEDYNNVNFNKKNFIKKTANYRWHGIFEQVFFPIQLYFDNLDLMHFTYFSYPIFYLKKFIATVHDITPLTHKTGRASTKNILSYLIKHIFFKIILWLQISNSKIILVPSNTVKQQLLKIFSIKLKEKTFVTYEGINHEIIKVSENSQLKDKFKNFYIYVGNFYPHKNVEKLISAFEMIKTNSQLVLIGPKDYFFKKIFEKVKKDNIIFFNNPKNSDLKFFYKNAKAIIHPSLSEGFGLPLVEAAYFNCQIIASDIKIFKEVLSGKYESFNPNSVQDIKKAILKQMRSNSQINYQEVIKNFSFKKMAIQTLEYYLRLI